jgi:cell division protein FtsW (lipid II flippase)
MGFQAFFIMAGVLRLLPFTGITLPFVAYGGNSLIANYLIVALLLRISDEGSTERHGGDIIAVQLTQVK